MKKNEFKKITAKVNDASKQVDSIMHNRLIIAILMIVDGINFIIKPMNSMSLMARIVAIYVFGASVALIITNIKSKNRDIKSIVIAIIMIIICVIIFIFPNSFAINLKLLSAIFIILNGLINIFNIKKLDKIALSLSYTENKIKDKFDKDKNDIDLKKGVILEQTEKVINPINNVIEIVNKESILYYVLNIISVILGVLLLTADNITFTICGVILIYTGAFDVLMFVKSKQLSKKLK